MDEYTVVPMLLST